MDYHRSFLISCIGAYEDSGIGTGGLVCVSKDCPVIIDKMDCVGLCRDGQNIYRFVRSIQSIVGYDKEGIRFLLRLPEIKDIHDIAIKDGNIICVSTGKNEICWFDPFGKLIKKWKAKGTGDAWHLNCLCFKDGKMYISAFGEFENHRGWTNGCKRTGFIQELDSNKKVLKDLSGPHHPRFADGNWIVCESHLKKLTIINAQGKIKKIQLEGFTRGIDYDKDFFYVGESANRKAETVPDYSFVTIISRNDLEIVDRIKIPFPEIYDILLISSEFAEEMINEKDKFIYDFKSERIQFLEAQVRSFSEECERLKYQTLRNRLGRLKYKIKQQLLSKQT